MSCLDRLNLQYYLILYLILTFCPETQPIIKSNYQTSSRKGHEDSNLRHPVFCESFDHQAIEPLFFPIKF